jgi:hypothetical protein
MDKTKEKIEQEFFDKLAEILEKEFPKKQCQERSHALVVNAFANLFLKEALIQLENNILRNKK